jgi:imidazolonepropionase-like amidohydrolase
VFPATSRDVLEAGTVIVAGGRIRWVGPAPEADLDALDVVDCTGRTIVPGLVDAHAHLVFGGQLDWYEFELATTLEQATIDAVLTASRLLASGVTAIRDVGTRGSVALAVRDAVGAGRIPGPRIRAAKQFISVRGGLADWHPTQLFDRGRYPSSLGELITGPWEARDAVRRQVKDGVDWIKAEGSGTGANPFCPGTRDTMSLEELRAVVEEAGDKGVPVACHAESRASIVRAATAGVRTVEHAVYLDDEGLEAILAHGVAICPTVEIFRNFAATGGAGRSASELARAQDPGDGSAPADADRRKHELHVEAMRRAVEAGATLIAGTDAGSSRFPHEGAIAKEIADYVELLGMSEPDALLTATRTAAEVIGLGDEMGTLEAGKAADLLVLGVDPFRDMRSLGASGAIEAVVQDGRVVAGRLPRADDKEVR